MGREAESQGEGVGASSCRLLPQPHPPLLPRWPPRFPDVPARAPAQVPTPTPARLASVECSAIARLCWRSRQRWCRRHAPPIRLRIGVPMEHLHSLNSMLLLWLHAANGHQEQEHLDIKTFFHLVADLGQILAWVLKIGERLFGGQTRVFDPCSVKVSLQLYGNSWTRPRAFSAASLG